MPEPVRKGLTQTRILQEARALVDAGGPDALTMRALAARLGVAAMAVYNHFEDRDGILDAMADEVFESLRQSAAQLARGRTSWRKRLHAVLMNTIRLADEHPHVFRIAFTRPQKPASAFALTTESLELLASAGLTPAQALTVYHSFVILLEGYPFWREGSAHFQESPAAAMLLPKGWTAKRQIQAVVEWLLDSVEALASAHSPTSR